MIVSDSVFDSIPYISERRYKSLIVSAFRIFQGYQRAVQLLSAVCEHGVFGCKQRLCTLNPGCANGAVRPAFLCRRYPMYAAADGIKSGCAVGENGFAVNGYNLAVCGNFVSRQSRFAAYRGNSDTGVSLDNRIERGVGHSRSHTVIENNYCFIIFIYRGLRSNLYGVYRAAVDFGYSKS